jgi:hemerythrin-like domain-containing protein
MRHQTATSVLRAEHRLILRVVDALEQALDVPASDGGPDIETMTDCVDFFRLFVDACHHGKEEAQLFPALEDSGLPRDDGPIAVMLEEHRRGRELVHRMAAGLEAMRSSDRATDTVHTAARAYIDLIRSHIGKEDEGLFAIADGILSGPPCQRLHDGYCAADACAFESRTKAQLEALAERIASRRLEH